jgi:hypothetical protein
MFVSGISGIPMKDSPKAECFAGQVNKRRHRVIVATSDMKSIVFTRGGC